MLETLPIFLFYYFKYLKRLRLISINITFFNNLSASDISNIHTQIKMKAAESPKILLKK